jgi:hypothetical protein
VSKKLFGKATVRIDGQELIKSQDAKFMLGGTVRNTVKGNEVYGYSEEAQEASVEINAFIASGTDLDKIASGTDVTVLVSLDSGQQYVMSHAWLETPPDVSEATNGGKTTLKYVATSAENVA